MKRRSFIKWISLLLAGLSSRWRTTSAPAVDTPPLDWFKVGDTRTGYVLRIKPAHWEALLPPPSRYVLPAPGDYEAWPDIPAHEAMLKLHLTNLKYGLIKSRRNHGGKPLPLP